jgi:predicted membrane-bound mannosyltransferase
MTLWVLIAVVALALRLTHLDAAPLNASEAREAMLAWRVGQSFQTAGRLESLPHASGYSPLLLAANTLLFTVCGASDALARLWPALFGSVLALTPFLLRRRIGRVGALAAGLYLALSPTALLASRQLERWP